MEGTMAVVITRLDVSAADLREAAARTQDAKAARRMLAIALVLGGGARGGAAAAWAARGGVRGGGGGAGWGAGGSGRRDLRDGAADAARLGASLQRVGAGGPHRPA